MKNHAFIMPVHNQPQLLRRIVTILQAPNHYFFIHVNARVRDFESFRNAMNGLNNVVFVEPRISVYHGRISQIEASIVLLENVEKHSVHFDYVHQISGQDYPLRSNEQFDAFFEQTEDSFMCFMFEEDRDVKAERRAVNSWFPNKSHTFLTKVYGRLRLPELLGKIIKREEVENLRSGWDWWTWSDKTYSFVLSYLRNNPGYLKRFNHTLSPCEKFFTTMLLPHVQNLGIRMYYPLRYVSWDPHRPLKTKYRPYNLTAEDYNYVIQSPCFFCRKVHESESIKLLDMIDLQRGNPFDISQFSKFC